MAPRIPSHGDVLLVEDDRLMHRHEMIVCELQLRPMNARGIFPLRFVCDDVGGEASALGSVTPDGRVVWNYWRRGVRSARRVAARRAVAQAAAGAV